MRDAAANAAAKKAGASYAILFAFLVASSNLAALSDELKLFVLGGIFNAPLLILSYLPYKPLSYLLYIIFYITLFPVLITPMLRMLANCSLHSAPGVWLVLFIGLSGWTFLRVYRAAMAG